MTILIRPNNASDNVARPFVPPMAASDAERIAFALEFMATALARIDHNLEVLVRDLRDRGRGR